MTMKKIFLTGITGFIAAEVARKLVEMGGYEVYALVRETSNGNSFDHIKDIINKIHIKKGNLTDYTVIKKIISDICPQQIVHIGAQTAVRASFEQPIEFNETNYLGTINLIHCALQLPSFEKFIFASTMESYGFQEARTPFKETLK